jgi:hypothetical protein
MDEYTVIYPYDRTVDGSEKKMNQEPLYTTLWVNLTNPKLDERVT